MSRRLADSGRKPLEINGSGLQHEYRFRASTGKNQKIEFAWENDGAQRRNPSEESRALFSDGYDAHSTGLINRNTNKIFLWINFICSRTPG